MKNKLLKIALTIFITVGTICILYFARPYMESFVWNLVNRPYEPLVSDEFENDKNSSNEIESADNSTENETEKNNSEEKNEVNNIQDKSENNIKKERVDETDSKKKDVSENEHIVNINYDEVYRDILDQCINIISERRFSDDFGLMSVSDAAAENYIEAYNKLGYVIEDINGDLIKELVFGNRFFYDGEGNQIYAIFTIENGKPVPVVDEIEDNMYFCNDGRLLCYGARGGDKLWFGDFTLNNAKIEWYDFYYSEHLIDSDDVNCFHNQTGTFESSDSEQLPIETGELWELSYDYRSRIVDKEFISMGEYVKNYIARTGKGKSIRTAYTLMSLDKVEKCEGYYVVTVSLNNTFDYDIIIDQNSVFEMEDYSVLGDRYMYGDSVAEWFGKYYDMYILSGDMQDYMSVVGVFDVRISGNHLDRIYGSYWWD